MKCYFQIICFSVSSAGSEAVEMVGASELALPVDPGQAVRAGWGQRVADSVGGKASLGCRDPCTASIVQVAGYLWS